VRIKLDRSSLLGVFVSVTTLIAVSLATKAELLEVELLVSVR